MAKITQVLPISGSRPQASESRDGGDDLFAVDRALVDPINGEADIGPSAIITADDFLADHRAAEDRIRFT